MALYMNRSTLYRIKKTTTRKERSLFKTDKKKTILRTIFPGGDQWI